MRCGALEDILPDPIVINGYTIAPGADLRDACLAGADLTGADLTGAALRGADLEGAHLTSADLWDADLRRANLEGADFAGANLEAACLTGAALRGACLKGATLTDANLTGADLTGAALTDANLTGADLTGAGLQGVNLTRADLTGANLTGVDLAGANLAGANLSRADLTCAKLRDAVLRGVDLTDARLVGADLRGAKLTGAKLVGAKLVGAKLVGADLRIANLRRADLQDADLGRADLRGAQFGGAQLEGANLEGAQLEGANLEDTIHAPADEDATDDVAIRVISRYPVASPAERKTFPCTRLVGAEIEYASCSEFAPIAAWAHEWGAGVHPDGSCGWECVTSPAAGDHMLEQAQDLVSAMRKADAQVDSHCSVHVHVDARDLGWPEIERLVQVYAKIEPALFLLGGQARIASKWCRPNGKILAEALRYEGEERKLALVKAIYSDQCNAAAKQRLRAGPLAKKDGARYVAMNLCPWLAGRRRMRIAVWSDKTYKTTYKPRHYRATDCTVEFRLHRHLEGLDGARLIGWMRLLARIVDWAAKASQAEVDALPTSAMRTLAIVAPDCAEWCLHRLRAWRKISRNRRRITYTPWGGYALRAGGHN